MVHVVQSLDVCSFPCGCFSFQRVRRLGEERDDVAIIIDSGADVALFLLNVAGQGKDSWNQFND